MRWKYGFLTIQGKIINEANTGNNTHIQQAKLSEKDSSMKRTSQSLTSKEIDYKRHAAIRTDINFS